MHDASMPRHARHAHAHIDASILALELVLAVVDATTAMDVVEALRHTPELLHALGEALVMIVVSIRPLRRIFGKMSRAAHAMGPQQSNAAEISKTAGHR